MRVMVFGAQSHIGFAICEKLLEEGIEVCGIFLDSTSEMRKLLLEERMLLIGRNALFHELTLDDDWRNIEATHVIYCKEKSDDQDLLCFEKSVETAVETRSHYFYVAPDPRQIEEDDQYHTSTLESYTLFNLPGLYGPFQPPEEKIHQHLKSCVAGQKNTLIINEPIIFITDAAETIVEIIEKGNYQKVYSFLCEQKDETIESVSVEVKINAKETESDGYRIMNKTSIEKGLLEQISCIKMYKEIYGIDS
ncbi:hypothetical protein [Metabacillus niabensis]|uniref:hypothetical protein n=1 Tax=Metabacillus niabensis TaxID=324854 RepID=UPI001CF99D22|nr:hypothetical protein [Metabacillus niabensis]